MLRATLKSLLSRKVRLVLSGLAVVLGVMAVAGAFILSATLSKSFDSLFQTVFSDVDVQVTGQKNLNISETEGGDALTKPIPASLQTEIENNVLGVKRAYGDVSVDGARVVGKDDKVITSDGPPRLGVNWETFENRPDLAQMRDGAAPQAPNEVALNESLAKDGDFKVGDDIGVLTLEPQQRFKISGIFGFSGDRETLGGETYVAFTEPVAQKLMLGEEGVYSSINVVADNGVSDNKLRDEIKQKIGDDYVVRTGEQAAKQESTDTKQFLDIIRNFLLGFAAVALFVGIFLILNTFSIIVAQRTRELALFRAMGASRGQVIRSVLVEALVIGFIASTLGLLAGMGVAWLLRKLMESQSNADLPGGGLSIPPSAIIAAYLVGMVITVIAAVVPALRASRVPPIAAMREAADTQRPLTRLTIAGGVVTMIGVVLVGLALFDQLGDANLYGLLFGVLLTFIGVAMLTPSIARPVVDVVGRVFSWSLPGKLGRRNSARNPRRTAITAAALMIGIALVTGVSVIASSLKDSLEKLFERDVAAQLVIAGDFTGGGSTLPTFDPTVIDQVKQLPEVASAAALWADAVEFDGGTTFVAGGDMTDLKKIFELKQEKGEVQQLKSGEVIVDDDFAKRNKLAVGDSMPIATQRGGPLDLNVMGIYEKTPVFSGPVISVQDAVAGFRFPLPTQGYINVKKGASVDKVQDEVDQLLKNNPEVSVQNQDELVKQASSQVDTFLTLLYILLGLAILIAILGIINTLALSMLERTRELGLLRAVGLSRVQTMRMVTVESIVISVFGALLGLAVGCALGAAVVKALQDEGFEVLSFPWVRMLVFLLLAVIVGLFAAILPAIRAARINVLRAIAYE